MNKVPDISLLAESPDSDLKQGQGHTRKGAQVSVITAQLHSHYTIVATGVSRSPYFVAALQDLRRCARSFPHSGSQPSLALALLLLRKSVAPDGVLRIRNCAL